MPIINQNAIKRRRSIRLSGYDYSKGGYYFVTLTLKTIACMFAGRSKNRLILTDVGKIAEKYWNEIPKHFHNAKMDLPCWIIVNIPQGEYVFMPDHIHGIIVLNNNVEVRHDKNVGVQYIEPLPQFKSKPQLKQQQYQRNQYQYIIPKSLGIIINYYKSAVTSCDSK